MKKTIDVHSYRDHRGGANRHGKREPMVHILGYDHEGSDLSSLCFRPKSAEKLCKAIMTAARKAERGKDWDKEVWVEDYDA